MATRKPTDRMCGAQIKGRPGWFCEKLKMDGVTRCRSHGGASPTAQEHRTKGIVRKQLHRMVTAIDKTDIEANPLEAFDTEFRTTVATIRYLNELVSELLLHDPEEEIPEGTQLAHAEALFWGKTETKEVGSGKWDEQGTDTTYAAGLHSVEVKRQWEREHLVKMTKIFIDAKVDERRAMMGERVLDTIDTLLNAVIVGMGGDPHDSAVRGIVKQAFEGIGVVAPKVIDA